MNGIDPDLLEQLSAWMDGELSPDQARFLQRRLDADPVLRAQFERWQVASACLRGQPVAAMPATLAPAIAAAIGREPKRRGAWPWLATAAALVLVAMLLPGQRAVEPGPAPLAQAPTSSPVGVPAGAADAGADADAMSPLPSVGDFPLAQLEPQPWPRSPLATDQQQLEAYLVGHNTLMAEDGLGGFMPYVDVVANDGAAPPSGADVPAAEEDALSMAGEPNRK